MYIARDPCEEYRRNPEQVIQFVTFGLVILSPKGVVYTDFCGLKM